jgi:hypothetical protein
VHFDITHSQGRGRNKTVEERQKKLEGRNKEGTMKVRK